MSATTLNDAPSTVTFERKAVTHDPRINAKEPWVVPVIERRNNVLWTITHNTFEDKASAIAFQSEAA